MSIGKKNVYVCQACGRKIVTLDIDEGVTPFMIPCKETEGCEEGLMRSCFYSVDQTLPVNYVWFIPKSLDGYSESMIEHINKGGLDIRKATQHEMWRGPC